MRAALSGARSVRVRGWMAEEADSAALEAVARVRPESEREANRLGRSAALDELRRLTGHRSSRVLKFVPLDGDDWVIDASFDAVEQQDLIEWAASVQRHPLDRCVITLHLCGLTNRRIAQIVQRDESRVHQVLRRAIQRCRDAQAA